MTKVPFFPTPNEHGRPRPIPHTYKTCVRAPLPVTKGGPGVRAALRGPVSPILHASSYLSVPNASESPPRRTRYASFQASTQRPVPWLGSLRRPSDLPSPSPSRPGLPSPSSFPSPSSSLCLCSSASAARRAIIGGMCVLGPPALPADRRKSNRLASGQKRTASSRQTPSSGPWKDRCVHRQRTALPSRRTSCT